LQRETCAITLINQIGLRSSSEYEPSYAASSIFKSFFVVIARKLFGITVVPDPEEVSTIPSFGTLLRGVGWVLKNFSYITTKRKEVNSRRVISTKDLLKKQLITKLGN